MKCSSMNRNGSMCRRFTGLLLVSTARFNRKNKEWIRLYRVTCRSHRLPAEQIDSRVDDILGAR